MRTWLYAAAVWLPVVGISFLLVAPLNAEVLTSAFVQIAAPEGTSSIPAVQPPLAQVNSGVFNTDFNLVAFGRAYATLNGSLFNASTIANGFSGGGEIGVASLQGPYRVDSIAAFTMSLTPSVSGVAQVGFHILPQTLIVNDLQPGSFAQLQWTLSVAGEQLYNVNALLERTASGWDFTLVALDVAAGLPEPVFGGSDGVRSAGALFPIVPVNALAGVPFLVEYNTQTTVFSELVNVGAGGGLGGPNTPGRGGHFIEARFGDPLNYQDPNQQPDPNDPDNFLNVRLLSDVLEIPEPATMTLFIVGLLALGVARRWWNE